MPQNSGVCILFLHYATQRNRENIVLRELLTMKFSWPISVTTRHSSNTFGSTLAAASIHLTLQNSTHHDGVNIVLREFFRTDIERIEGICAIGTMLQQVLFRFRLFLHGLVFPEAVASTFYTCRLNSEYQVIVILSILRYETFSLSLNIDVSI